VARILPISRKMNLAFLLRLSRSCANSGLPGLLQSVVFSAGSDVGRKRPEQGAHFQAYPAFLLPTLPLSGGPPVIYSPLGRAVI
jgi:hypothetical protein